MSSSTNLDEIQGQRAASASPLMPDVEAPPVDDAKPGMASGEEAKESLQPDVAAAAEGQQPTSTGQTKAPEQDVGTTANEPAKKEKQDSAAQDAPSSSSAGDKQPSSTKEVADVPSKVEGEGKETGSTTDVATDNEGARTTAGDKQLSPSQETADASSKVDGPAGPKEREVEEQKQHAQGQPVPLPEGGSPPSQPQTGTPPAEPKPEQAPDEAVSKAEPPSTDQPKPPSPEQAQAAAQPQEPRDASPEEQQTPQPGDGAVIPRKERGVVLVLDKTLSPLADGEVPQSVPITPGKTVGLMSPTAAMSPKTRTRLVATYHKGNVLKAIFAYFLTCVLLLYGGLCYVVDMMLGTKNMRTEDFGYRILAFHFATACAGIALCCYFSRLETKHKERIASATSAATLALLSLATHLIIGFQALPIVPSYIQGRAFHSVRGPEKICEALVVIVIMETIDWRKKQSVKSIAYQVGAQIIATAGHYMPWFITGLGCEVIGLLLYGQIFYLWRGWLQRYRENRKKPKIERNKNVNTAFKLVNTYFISTNLLIAIEVLSLIGLLDYRLESLMMSGVDVLTKLVYGLILTGK